jgi:nucleoside-diphosphate-sugar epimerase
MVLITGANGFVGRHLVARLAGRNMPVRRAVRRPADEGADRDTFVVGDIDGGTEWLAPLDGVHTVVHLAGLAHVDSRQLPDPLAAYRRVNTAGTLALANAAVAAGVRRFIFVSTVKVNGEDSGARPFSPQDEPAPADPYGISKLEAEQGLRTVAGASMQVAILRPPLVYGPGVRANFLRLLQLIARGVPLPLGSLENRRSLVCVENLCDLIQRCIEQQPSIAGTFMVSDGDDLSTPEMIRRLARSLQRPARLVRFPVRLLELAARVTRHHGAFVRLAGSLQVDISETRRHFDWSPPLSTVQGFERTARWFRAQ